MNTDITSIWSYHEILESGKVSILHGKYLSVFSECNRPLTMNQFVEEYKKKFGDVPYKTHHGVGPRITELTRMGFLDKLPEPVKCEYTGKKVRQWIYTGRRDSKIKMVQEVCCRKCGGCGVVEEVKWIDL